MGQARLIGALLAILGNLVISLSLTLQKLVHNIIKKKQLQSSLEPNAEPVSETYLKYPLWWAGIILMAMGELGNFAAYGFASPSLVAPLGAVSVIANVMFAAGFLKEPVSLRNLVGVALAIFGSTVIIIAAPHGEEDWTMDELGDALMEPVFVVYFLVLIAGVIVFVILSKKYGDKTCLFYILVCSLLGAITVSSCKGVATFLRMLMTGGDVFSVLPLILTATFASTIFFQIKYLNAAMQHYGASEVVPVYYVCFTISCIVAGSVLYKDFYNVSPVDAIVFLLGMAMTCGGVYLVAGGSNTEGEPSDSVWRAKEARGSITDLEWDRTSSRGAVGSVTAISAAPGFAGAGPARKGSGEAEELLKYSLMPSGRKHSEGSTRSYASSSDNATPTPGGGGSKQDTSRAGGGLGSPATGRPGGITHSASADSLMS